MSKEEKYQVIDCRTSVNLQNDSYAEVARTRLSGSHAGQMDPGHVCKTLFDQDDFSLIWVMQEAGVSSPYTDFVAHPDADEIEFVLSGNCRLLFPDGFDEPISAGACFYIKAGQPHGNRHYELDNLNLLVFYPKRISQIDRVKFEEGAAYTCQGGYHLTEMTKMSLTTVSPGHKAVNLCECTGISAAYHVLEPGKSVPERDFIAQDVDEIIFIYEGGGIASYPDKSYTLHPQLAFYNPVGTPHRFWNNTTEELRLIVLYVTSSLDAIKTTSISL